MLMSLIRCLALLSLCLALPASAQGTDSRLSEKDAAALRAMIPAMETAWRSRDAKAYAAQFSADAEHINAYGMWWRGGQEIAQAMTFTLEKIYPNNPLVADQTTVKAIAPGVAVVQYRWHLQPYSDPDGTRYAKPSGRVTQIVVKRPEGWRITHFQSTFINPAVRHSR